MPRFVFHIRNGLGFVPDEEGAEIPSVEAARLHAVRGARSLMSAEVTEGELDLRGRLEVTDTEGTPVLMLPFREGGADHGRRAAAGG